MNNKLLIPIGVLLGVIALIYVAIASTPCYIAKTGETGFIYKRSVIQSCNITAKPDLLFTPKFELFPISIYETDVTNYWYVTEAKILLKTAQTTLTTISFAQKQIPATQASTELQSAYPFFDLFPIYTDNTVSEYGLKPNTLYLYSAKLTETGARQELDTYLATKGRSVSELESKYQVTILFNQTKEIGQN